MKAIKLYLAAFATATSLLTGFAQEEKSSPIKLKFEARADYNHDSKSDEESGLKGNIIDVKLEGDINDRFAYKYRQRLNKPNKDATFFDATDWLYLTYRANKNVSLMAGKWIVALGGWETEPAPIDVFQISEFCYNYACYQWGASVILNTNNKQHEVYMQMCQSPFRKSYELTTGKSHEMWAYNVLWIGNAGFFHNFYSVNMMEYRPGKFMNFIALGNRFDLCPEFSVDLDLQSRATCGSDFLKDYTISSSLSYHPTKALNCFAKFSMDKNSTGHDSDLCVFDGTDMKRIGGGIEYFPLKDDRVRLHAQYSYAWGTNTNENGVLKDKQSIVNVGLTWRMHILK